MHDTLLRSNLEALKMTEADMKLYQGYRENCKKEIRKLQVILESVQAKKKERIWIKNQTNGDLDESRLVEGIIGDKNIYKIRGDNQNTVMYQEHPKRIRIVFDLSASMVRFNGHDLRLERSLECALLIMEAFKSFGHAFDIYLSGHSGIVKFDFRGRPLH